MRRLTLLLAVLSVVACEEKDLTDKNPAPAPENVYVATSFYYDGERFYPDTAIVNNLGLSFFITDVQVVFSEFYYYEGPDTLATDPEPFVISIDEPLQHLVELPPGGYSGRYSLRLGVDSLQSIDLMEASLPDDHELVEAGMIRENRKGIDNVVIRGRLIDPENIEDTTGTIDLEYRLATHVTSKKEVSGLKHFSMVKNSDVQFVIHVDLEPIFNDFDMDARPTVTTDESNLIDYGVAQEMADSLRIRLY